jgi:hypothetical protein
MRNKWSRLVRATGRQASSPQAASLLKPPLSTRLLSPLSPLHNTLPTKIGGKGASTSSCPAVDLARRHHGDMSIIYPKESFMRTHAFVSVKKHSFFNKKKEKYPFFFTQRKASTNEYYH